MMILERNLTMFYIVTHLKCLATATQYFKWLKITAICSIWHQPFANLDI